MSRLAWFVPFVALLAVPVGAAPVPKGPPPVPVREWPMFGGTPFRNMENRHEKLERFPTVAPPWGDDADADKKWEDEWVLWKAQLGSRAFAGPEAHNLVERARAMYSASIPNWWKMEPTSSSNAMANCVPAAAGASAPRCLVATSTNRDRIHCSIRLPSRPASGPSLSIPRSRAKGWAAC